jgi:hypothetical protein
MAWSIERRYVENCTCEVVCPCAASLALGADNDYCRGILAFHIDKGDVDGVDVSGLTLAALVESSKHMYEGNWRLGVLIDDSASEQQVEKLRAVFSGQLGGPMAALSGLVGEQLGVERVPMKFSSSGGKHRLKIGDMGQAAIEDVVSFGKQDGEPARLAGIFHPVAGELTIAKAAEDSGLTAFGITFGGPGKAGFSHEFSWAG